MADPDLFLADEAATVLAGHNLASAVAPFIAAAPGAIVIYLHGRLGAGKTTLCRGFLRGFGHEGSVKSPTYTLVEPYHPPGGEVYHFDLYRLKDPAELDYLGVEEYFRHGSVCLLEWPEKGEERIPLPDLSLTLLPHAAGRNLQLAGCSERGKKAVETFSRLRK